MKNQIFSFLLTMLLCMTGITAFAHDIEVKNDDGVTIYYVWTNNKTELAVSYRGSNYDSYSDEYSGTVVIPASVTYNGSTYGVTSIGACAFYNCTGLTSITIPNSVTSIGGSAFKGTGWYNNQPDGILYLDGWLIGVKGEKPTGNLLIAEGTRGIAGYAFSGCSGLTSVTIPNSVTSIGNNAFYGCSGLVSVTIPNSVTSIGEGAFGCSGLTSITIPNSVTNIGGYAFFGCSGLVSVTIPNSVTYIGSCAFGDCSGLTSVTIPNSVTYIGSGAFAGCNRITSIYITDLSAWCNLFNVNRTEPIISGNHHLYLNGVEIERLSIPNSFTSIGNYAFSGCGYITSITIPNSVTTIGESAFENCSMLEELKLPDNLQIIKKATFKGCNSLKSVTIPSTVEVIYQEAFAGNYKMESVKALPETPPFLYANSFSNYNIPLFASETAIAAYQAHETWGKFAQFMTFDGSEVEVPQCATPTIDYANWKLTFKCETEGAEIVTKAVCSDTKEGNGGEMNLTPTYTITAYAKAEGYRDSDVATATISWKDGRPVIIRGFNNASLEEGEPICDVNNDGTVDVADIATIISKIAGK